MAGINLSAQMVKAVLKDGDQTYEVVRMFTREGVIWQTSQDVTYEITNVLISYSSGTAIAADGSGYAVIRGRVKIYRGRTLIYDYGTQTLQPRLPDGCVDFYLDGTKIKAHNRHKVEGDALSCVVGYSFGSSGVGTAGFVHQQANVKTEKSSSTTTTAYSVSFTPPTGGITPDGATVALVGTRTYTLTKVYQYTSLEEETVVTQGLTMTVAPTTVTFSAGGGISYSNGNITVTTNYRNTQARTWEMVGHYDGFDTTTQYVIQAGDSYTDTTVKDNYVALMGIGSGTITAGQSSVDLWVSASHRERTFRDWTYGQDQYLNEKSVTDTPTIVESGDEHDRYSIDGLEVTHTSMGKDVTTDYAKFSITNGDQTACVEFSVTNTKTHTFSYRTIEVEAEDITCTDTAFAIKAYVTNTYADSWTSGDTDTSIDHAGTIKIYNGATYLGEKTNGQTLSWTVNNNKHSLDNRTWAISGKIGDDSSESVTLTQGSDSLYWDANYSVRGHYINVSEAEDADATGGEIEFSINSYRTEYKNRRWSSDNQVYGDPQTRNVAEGWNYSVVLASSYFHPSASGNVLTVTHDNMQRRGTDTYQIKFYNTASSSVESEIYSYSIANALGTVKFKNTSGTQGENVEAGSISTYGIPTKPTVGSGITAAGGYATISGSTVTNKRTYNKTYYYRYASGAYDDKHTDFYENRNEAGSVYYQLVDAALRYSIDDDVLYHNGMGQDETTDSCIVRAVNSGSTQRYQDSATVSVTNTKTSSTTHQHSCAIDYDEGEFPVNGGTYTVNYIIVKKVNSSWTSGASSSVTSDETASVTATNCTASVNSVTGTGSLTITVAKNTSSSSREVKVVIGNTFDSRDQDPLLISSITLSPSTMSGQRGSNQAITAYANWTDGTQTNVSSVATWSSTASNVAYYSSGKVYFSAVGSATIRASYKGLSASCAVTVTVPVTYSLELGYTDVTMPVPVGGFTQTVTLVGSDGSRTALSYDDLQITYGGNLATYVGNYQFNFYFKGTFPSSQQVGNITFRYSAKNIDAYTHVTVKSSY